MTRLKKVAKRHFFELSAVSSPSSTSRSVVLACSPLDDARELLRRRDERGASRPPAGRRPSRGASGQCRAARASRRARPRPGRRRRRAGASAAAARGASARASCAVQGSARDRARASRAARQALPRRRRRCGSVARRCWRPAAPSSNLPRCLCVSRATRCAVRARPRSAPRRAASPRGAPADRPPAPAPSTESISFFDLLDAARCFSACFIEVGDESWRAASSSTMQRRRSTPRGPLPPRARAAASASRGAKSVENHRRDKREQLAMRRATRRPARTRPTASAAGRCADRRRAGIGRRRSSLRF